MSKILFYRVREPYGEFSNFSPHPIKLKGKTWPTSEHYFQAQKFAGTEHEEEIRRAKSPMMAARMGRSRKQPLRKDWELAKETIMREVCAPSLLCIWRCSRCSFLLVTRPLSSTPEMMIIGEMVEMERERIGSEFC